MRAVVLLALVVLVSASVLAKKSAEKTREAWQDAIPQDGQPGKLPSLSNDRDRAEMRCSACQTARRFLTKRLEGVAAGFPKALDRVQGYHVDEAVEDMCEDEKDFMGLKRNAHNSDTTTTFFDERDPYNGQVLKGDWVTRLWVNECHALVTRAENSALAFIRGKKAKAKKWCAKLCKKAKEFKSAADEEEEE